jgi:hypothetical protein
MHALSGIRTHEQAKTVLALDRAAAVIGIHTNKLYMMDHCVTLE